MWRGFRIPAAQKHGKLFSYRDGETAPQPVGQFSFKDVTLANDTTRGVLFFCLLFFFFLLSADVLHSTTRWSDVLL